MCRTRTEVYKITGGDYRILMELIWGL
uniref:Uncharacterized protein n=1 Tax=Anguilla anguilla TaxID=7936 RepID=A0A0E9VWI1_ANGAN